MKKTLIVEGKVRTIFLYLGISALITTEYSLIATAILVTTYFILFLQNTGTLLGLFAGLMNYFLNGIGGGFPAALLIWLSSADKINKYTKPIFIISIIILLVSFIMLNNNQANLNTFSPFHIKWWCDLGLTGILLTTCDSLFSARCLS